MRAFRFLAHMVRLFSRIVLFALRLPRMAFGLDQVSHETPHTTLSRMWRDIETGLHGRMRSELQQGATVKA